MTRRHSSSGYSAIATRGPTTPALLTTTSTLPVGAEFPGKTAGPNFEFYRTGYLLPHRHAAWVLMHERLLELAAYCAGLSARPSAPAELTTIGESFRKLAGTLEQHIGRDDGDAG